MKIWFRLKFLDFLERLRFSASAKILARWLVVCICLEGQLDEGVVRDFYAVHHLRESIAFYCKPLLSVLRSENVLGVVCRETLADDCADLLRIDAASARIRGNSFKSHIEKVVDLKVLKNLKRFLADGCSCLTFLWSIASLGSNKFLRVMSSSLEKRLKIGI